MRRWPWQNRANGRSRLWLYIIGGVIALIVVGLLAAPSIIKRVVGSSLEDMPGGYRGTIESVDLRPLAAEIAIVGLKIEKKTGDIPVPYIVMRELVICTIRDSWKLRTKLRIVEPIVNVVDAPREAQQQWGPKFDLAGLRKQLPFELSEVLIENAQVHFRNFHAKPEIDAFLHTASVTWTGLVGCLPPGSSACRSHMGAASGFMKSGAARLRGGFERRPEPRIEMRLSVREVQAQELSPLLTEYAKVDLQGGVVAADVRYVGEGDSHSIRIIPRLSNLKVVGSESKDTRFFREVGLAMAAGWFERKSGEKAIAIESKAGGKFDFSLVDLKGESADGKKD